MGVGGEDKIGWRDESRALNALADLAKRLALLGREGYQAELEWCLWVFLIVFL